MTSQEALLVLSKQLGCPLHWDQNQLCHLLIDDDQQLLIERFDDESAIFLHASMAEAPSDDIQLIASELLSANLFHQETGGKATLAYEQEEQLIILFQRFELATLNAQVLLADFHQFLDQASRWRKKLADPGYASLIKQKTVAMPRSSHDELLYSMSVSNRLSVKI